MVRPEHTALRMSIGADPDGQIRGIELYPECEYATAVHYVFDMDGLVRYVRFRGFLPEEMSATSAGLLREWSRLATDGLQSRRTTRGSAGADR